jgi:hypothetical protein
VVQKIKGTLPCIPSLRLSWRHIFRQGGEESNKMNCHNTEVRDLFRVSGTNITRHLELMSKTALIPLMIIFNIYIHQSPGTVEISVSFEVLTAVTVNSTILWNVMSYRIFCKT